MIKTFNKEYYLNHRGCYSEEKMSNLVDNNVHFTLQDFLNWNIPIKDKFYFVRNYVELTAKQKQLLALMCAKVSLEIYENKYPNDKRVIECIEAIEQFINGAITKEELLIKKKAAVPTAYAAYAAYAADATDAAYAADATDAAASAVAAYAIDAIDADGYAAVATVYAYTAIAIAADRKDYHKNKLLNALKQFCIDNN